ncbi:hypothetical protein [Mycolicibacterium goodii]|uniref:Uncharacterized protein n=1 Tax=Mycolicibacterium goodii TaxID=134601 RepID=A0ABS6HIX5_MYCGD|nr:hypothetical protein [Mycolicibacterium goodii]MBU8809228.1 hypothetical protein [Mycolicibacterium goodii]MBU8821875.1 hypothetical protein [Mycolicibacterium goodii]MBU8836867.1 hypothetical protein [Mycolicibacterium goodii]
MAAHRASTKATGSTKYVGYVGGVAVAMGVGAAIAVAGQGTAHADTDGAAKESSASTSSGASSGASSGTGSGVNAGPKRTETKSAAKTDRPKPLSKVSAGVQKAEKAVSQAAEKAVTKAAARAEKAAARTEKAVDHVSDQLTKAASTVSKSVTDSLTKPVSKPVSKPVIKPVLEDAAKDFETRQVARLKELFTPKPIAAPKPDTASDSALENTAQAGKTPTNVVRTAVQTQADTDVDAAADQPWSPNPLRPVDPDPTDFPDAIMDLRDALLGASPDVFDPFVREATEQIYRGSQIVPWVNAVIPISKILPNLAPALSEDIEVARDARQLIITELIKTTPPGSALYYGYDIVADLINLEGPAAGLKYRAVATVWNILDPLQLVHNTDKAVGIGSAAG